MKEDSFLRRAGGAFLSFFPHLLMAFSWIMLTLYVINIFNPAMCFLTDKVSQKFELIYAGITLICAGIVFLRGSLYQKHDTKTEKIISVMQKSLRILALAASAAAVAMAVPVFRSLSSNNRNPIENRLFEMSVLIAGILTLVFSIFNITVQHHQVKAEYLAGKK
ncbi:MAG: hypothetical protein IKI58_01685 [Oscillospiraceae bacterium]|nr:hypothetical protein [Oscillospiraceae bacterium]